MRPEEIIKEINKLNISEKLLLIEDVWDAIALSNSDLPISEWQKRELDARYNNYKNGEMKLHSWESVHADIKNKHS